jgi:hypothetical protein
MKIDAQAPTTDRNRPKKSFRLLIYKASSGQKKFHFAARGPADSDVDRSINILPTN